MSAAGAVPGAGEEVGGRSPVRILLRVGRDVANAFATLSDAIAAHTHGTIEGEVTVGTPGLARVLLQELETSLTSAKPRPPAADIVVLSMADDIDAWTAHPGPTGAQAAGDWYDAMRAVCQHLKAAGSRVFVCNASTVVPDDHCSDYHGVPEPASVFANRLDAALIELSIAEGISIIDVDGILAELGADEHVTGLVTYSAAALDAVRTDLVRVLDDYGFFQPRTLLPQRGHRVA